MNNNLKKARLKITKIIKSHKIKEELKIFAEEWL